MIASKNWIELYERHERESSSEREELLFPIHPVVKAILELRPDIQKIGSIDDPWNRLKINMWWSQWGYLQYPGVPQVPSPKGFEGAFELSDKYRDDPLPFTKYIECNIELFPEIAKGFDLGDDRSRLNFLRLYYSHHTTDTNQFDCFSRELREYLLKPDPYWSDFDPSTPRYVGLIFEKAMDENRSLTKEVLIEHTHRQIKAAKDKDYMYYGLEGTIEQWLKRKNASLITAKSDAAHPAGVNLIGPALGELGIGEDARLMAFSLKRAGIPFSIFEFPKNGGARNNDFSAKEFIRNDNPYFINLFCLPPLESFLALAQLPGEFFKGRRNITFSPWELPHWPKIHEALFDIYDEIWCATDFVYDGCPKWVKNRFKMPLPVSLDHLDTTKLIRRAEFGLDSDRFYFLFMFDSNSRVHRKNPIACLRAFQKAFPDLDEKVGVVVKSMNLKPDSSDSIELLNQAGSDPRIKIFSEIFDRQRTIDLMRACDAFLSLHRSEGFGRGLAEAMLLERPAIGTGFSGNLEFMNEENSYLVSYKTIPVGGRIPMLKMQQLKCANALQI